jgi:hypothetical protein
VKTCDLLSGEPAIGSKGRPNFRLLPQILTLISPAQDDISKPASAAGSHFGKLEMQSDGCNALAVLLIESDATALPTQADGRALQRSKAAIQRKNLRASQ